MSKAYKIICESLNEIINDLEENDGKNLIREVVVKEKSDKTKSFMIDNIKFTEKPLEQTMV